VSDSNTCVLSSAIRIRFCERRVGEAFEIWLGEGFSRFVPKLASVSDGFGVSKTLLSTIGKAEAVRTTFGDGLAAGY
jgi:hypothetical protein